MNPQSRTLRLLAIVALAAVGVAMTAEFATPAVAMIAPEPWTEAGCEVSNRPITVTCVVAWGLYPAR